MDSTRKTHLSPSTTTDTTAFKREIGVFGGVSIIAGAMVGSGIFYLGSQVLQACALHPGLALLCWVVGGVVSLLGGLCFAELGAAMPRAGGYIVYLNRAFHPVVGHMAGFTDFFIGGPGSSAAIALALMAALDGWLGLGPVGVKAGAIALITVITAYNLMGVKLVSRLLNVALVAKLIPIAVIIVAALLLGRESPDLGGMGRAVAASGGMGGLFSALAMAIVATLWAYEGWMNLNIVTEEMTNPHRNLPLALGLGIGGVAVLYTLFNFAIVRVLPQDTIASLLASGEIYLGTQAIVTVLGQTGGWLVSATMIVAMFGALNGFMLAGPRLCYAIAREGHFFGVFARLHATTAVPTAAIILQGILASALVLASHLDQLTAMVVVCMMLFKLLTILAVPVLRQKFPDMARPYRVPLYPFSVIVSAVIFAALFLNAVFSDALLGLAGFCVPAIGAVVYFAFARAQKKG